MKRSILACILIIGANNLMAGPDFSKKIEADSFKLEMVMPYNSNFSNSECFNAFSNAHVTSAGAIVANGFSLLKDNNPFEVFKNESGSDPFSQFNKKASASFKIAGKAFSAAPVEIYITRLLATSGNYKIIVINSQLCSAVFSAKVASGSNAKKSDVISQENRQDKKGA